MAKFSDATYPIKEYHQAVAAFCHSNGIKVLDLLPAFWGGDGTQYWISATDGHPNAALMEKMGLKPTAVR